MYLYMMNKKAFVKKYVRTPIVLSKVEQGQMYCMIDYTEPLKYTEVIATTDGKDLYNESLLVKDSDNKITELFPTAASETESGEGQTLHELKPMSLPKTAKSRKHRSRSPRVMTARKSRSSKGGSKTKRTEVCRLCEKEFKADDEIPKLKCKHKFHKKCLKPLCMRTNNHNVMCPVEGCGGHISYFECAADISRDTPWEYDPFDSTDGNSLINSAEWSELTDDERAELSKEFKKLKAKYSKELRAFVNSDATPEERIDHLIAENVARSASMQRQAESYKASVLKLTGRLP
jgi:hypothetical protein